MSVQVDLEALHERIAEYGARTFLVTVDDVGSPHVVSVTLRSDDGCLRVRAGRRTRSNLRRDPRLTLLWPERADDAYCLIVDAVATDLEDDDEITVAPGYAVLHRVAGAVGEGPSCKPLADG